MQICWYEWWVLVLNCSVAEYVSYMQKVAAAAPELPFYLYDVDFITGIRCTSILCKLNQ